MRAASYWEADELATSGPLIAAGYEMYYLRTLEVVDASTGY